MQQQPPDTDDAWWELLAAITDRARRDASSPTLKEATREEARRFLQWLEAERDELCRDLCS